MRRRKFMCLAVISTFLESLGNPALAGAHESEFYEIKRIFEEDDNMHKRVARVASRLNANKLTINLAKKEWEGLLWEAKQRRGAAKERLYESWYSTTPPGRRLTEFHPDLFRLLGLQVTRIEQLISCSQIEIARGLSAAKPHWDKQRISFARYERVKTRLGKQIHAKFLSTP